MTKETRMTNDKMTKTILHVLVVAVIAAGAFLVGTRFGREPGAEVKQAQATPGMFLASSESGPRVPFLLFRETSDGVIEPVGVAPDDLLRPADPNVWDKEMRFGMQWHPFKHSNASVGMIVHDRENFTLYLAHVR